MTSPLAVVAVDPGDKHVGIALGLHPGSCYHADTLDPAAFLALFRRYCGSHSVDVVVVEDWRLQPDKASVLGGSDMPTCRLIGRIEEIAEWYGVPLLKQQPFDQETDRRTVPGQGVKSLDLPHVPANLRIHARDSQLHFWHFAWYNHRALHHEVA